MDWWRTSLESSDTELPVQTKNLMVLIPILLLELLVGELLVDETWDGRLEVDTVELGSAERAVGRERVPTCMFLTSHLDDL